MVNFTNLSTVTEAFKSVLQFGTWESPKEPSTQETCMDLAKIADALEIRPVAIRKMIATYLTTSNLWAIIIEKYGGERMAVHLEEVQGQDDAAAVRTLLATRNGDSVDSPMLVSVFDVVSGSALSHAIKGKTAVSKLIKSSQAMKRYYDISMTIWSALMEALVVKNEALTFAEQVSPDISLHILKRRFKGTSKYLKEQHVFTLRQIAIDLGAKEQQVLNMDVGQLSDVIAEVNQIAEESVKRSINKCKVRLENLNSQSKLVSAKGGMSQKEYGEIRMQYSKLLKLAQNFNSTKNFFLYDDDDRKAFCVSDKDCTTSVARLKIYAAEIGTTADTCMKTISDAEKVRLQERKKNGEEMGLVDKARSWFS